MAVVDDGFYGPDPRRRALIQTYLDEALAIDPDFALAHAWKAFTFAMSGVLESVAPENRFNFISETFRLARMHNDMALALDPTLGLAHALQAQIYDFDGRSEEARLEREQALRLSPNDPWMLTLLAGGGPDQIEEKITIHERIVELSPNVAESHAGLGNALLRAGRAVDAREAFQKCLSLDPTAGGCTRTLAWAEFALGNNEEALNGLRRREQISTGVRQMADVAYGYGRLGQAEDARRVFETLRTRAVDEYVSASQWALAHMGVGDYDEALVLLNAAADDLELPLEEQLGQDMQALQGIFGNVWSDPMLEEPEFVEVLERIRIAQ
jgi:Flp pilus assembly protein TadD